MTELKTNYYVDEIPFPEYPRPMERRKEWLNLNGKWHFAKVKKEQTPTEFTTILVPFSPESANSGVGNGFTLETGEKLVYSRLFHLNLEENVVVLLHFGAVDHTAEVFINGKAVGSHVGGYTPFTLDVSPFVQDGKNELRVEVTDDPHHGARGKQSKTPGGIWYTAHSGIWQTVWLETLPKDYIRELRYEIDAENKKVVLFAQSNGREQVATVYDGETEIASVRFTDRAEIVYDFEWWSPESPKLYAVKLVNDAGDEVSSYFGFRTFGIGKDGHGKARLLLNGKPYFFSGVLDQGYWSDGLLTPPCDKAMKDELKLIKAMGFNTVRKHIKIEPLRWYYHCDRLGLVVWQDFVNGGGEYKFSHIATLPFLGFRHKDDDYKYFAREDEDGRREFRKAMDETVEALRGAVSVGVWTIFNEGWGQFDSARLAKRLAEKDPTRIVDSVSGWHDQGKEKTTLKSLHVYYTPLKVPRDPRPVVLSEFGGYSLKIGGHVYREDKEFGYKKFSSKKALTAALEKLYTKKLKPLVKKGLCAAIYTQVSDVEEETNGLVTYDRKVVKVDAEQMKRLQLALYEEMKDL